MQLDRSTVQDLQKVSDFIAEVLRSVDVAEKRASNAWFGDPRYEISDNKITFRFDNGSIEYRDIVPGKVMGVSVDTPIHLNERTETNILDEWVNDSATEEEFDHKWSEEHSETDQNDIVDDLTAAIEAKIGGGSPTFNAEMKASIQNRLQIGEHKTTSVKKSDEKELKIEIPPYTQTTMTQTTSVSDVRQAVTTMCLLDAKVRITASDYDIAFDSLHALELYFQGGGNSSSEKLDEVFHRYQADIKLPFLVASVKEDRLYQDSHTGKSVRKDVPIVR